ncbi:MAG: glycosyltransferase family 1 protein [Candidatus Dadabacteria bacterium]|nr:MAG: glycosyltransferase family 1 protein [Candidatus Dadabacteria bacterium]
MDILIINQCWFVNQLRDAGHTVTTCALTGDPDILLDGPVIHIETIIKEHLGGRRPERILVLDNSAPLIVTGLEDARIPAVFYAVDTHHHLELHKYLYNVFDKTFIAQRDYLDDFIKDGMHPEWMPLWASRYVEASNDKKYGAVFVGNLDKKLNPDRVEFFDKLSKRTEIYCTIGKYWEIFPHSEIVVNQTVKGDLNFRVFEAMMCGAMLLTEMSANGLTDLFTPGKHLVTYTKHDDREAAEKIEYYLSNISLCREIAHAGREEILARHLEDHRAEVIEQALREVEHTESPLVHFSLAANYMMLFNRLVGIDTAYARRALIHTMKSFERGVGRGEQMTTELAYHAVLAALKYDQWFGSTAGGELLHKMSEAYSEFPLIALAEIRRLLNRGEIENARRLARNLSDQDVKLTFSNAEKVISELLDIGAQSERI